MSVPRKLRRRGRPGALTVEQIIVLIYLRVSTYEQEESGLSLPNQLKDARRYCSRHDDWIAGEVFQDTMSGKRDDRPGYAALLLEVRGHALAGKKVIVVVQRLDRIGRNMTERVRAWDELEALGAEIHSDAEGATPRFIYAVYAAAAEEEIRVLSDRVRRVWDGLDEHGWHHPGRASWGYDWRPRSDQEKALGAPESVLVPHAEHAAYAQELWTRYAGGESAEALLRWARSLPETARGPRRFSSSAFRELLRSPVYIGRLGRDHDIAVCVAEEERCPILDEPPGRWVPLVSDETWDRAHHQYRRARRIPMQASDGYLLTGMIRCLACGGRMVGNTNGRYVRYLCNSRCTGTEEQRANPCYAVVQAKAVDEAVIETIGGMLDAVLDRSALPAMRQRYREDLAEASRDTTSRRRASTEAKLAEAHKMVSAASQRFFKDEITKLAYDVTVADLTEQIDALTAEVARLRQQDKRPKPVPLEVLMGALGGWAEAFRDAAIGQQRTALSQLVEWVKPHRVARGRYEVTLGLTSLGLAALSYAVAAVPDPNLVAVQRFGTTIRWTPTNPQPLEQPDPAPLTRAG